MSFPLIVLIIVIKFMYSTYRMFLFMIILYMLFIQQSFSVVYPKDKLYKSLQIREKK